MQKWTLHMWSTNQTAATVLNPYTIPTPDAHLIILLNSRLARTSLFKGSPLQYGSHCKTSMHTSHTLHQACSRNSSYQIKNCLNRHTRVHFSDFHHKVFSKTKTLTSSREGKGLFITLSQFLPAENHKCSRDLSALEKMPMSHPLKALSPQTRLWGRQPKQLHTSTWQQLSLPWHTPKPCCLKV